MVSDSSAVELAYSVESARGHPDYGVFVVWGKYTTGERHRLYIVSALARNAY